MLYRCGQQSKKGLRFIINRLRSPRALAVAARWVNAEVPVVFGSANVPGLLWPTRTVSD